ncbi:molecular chaperone GrpE [Buchnera aphidicola (Diuraphis noxia)]|uniref:Protein GrpE n=1 Tax=Buchnera aphidicola subsp. Diuraphis noxia TaxID=118101 RepID=A0A1B2H877_BUCDN|nr:nucleotide exchange factor GrpE [Buchnera aphidicola]ANZ22414.1 molecular chaperone GrpE [Buchnera aphidicola (Diuraphis noxia)]
MDNQTNNLNANIAEEEKENIENDNKKIHNLKSQILKNEKKINEIELRKLAHIENIKKNTTETINTIKKEQIEKFLKTIIPIIDSLESIVQLSNKLDSKNEPLIEGIQLTLKSFLNTLFNLDVKIEGQEKELFNPNIHDAIRLEKSNTTPPNHIIFVDKKGFSLNKTILRKAKVIISKE